MIVFETALASIFDQLPIITDQATPPNEFKPRFEWGTQDVLNKFITLADTTSKYPLIWLVNGTENHTVSNKRVQRQTRIVIAKESESPNDFNRLLFQTEFDLILNPVLEKILKALERSGISKIVNYDYTVQRMPNYSEVLNEGKTVAIWNAIVFEANIELHGQRCLKTINFN